MYYGNVMLGRALRKMKLSNYNMCDILFGNNLVSSGPCAFGNKRMSHNLAYVMLQQ